MAWNLLASWKAMHLVESRNVSIEFKKIKSKSSCWVSLPACANFLFSSSFKTCFFFLECQREERSHSAKQIVFSTPLLFIALRRGGKALSRETAVQMTRCLRFGQAQCCSDQASGAAPLPAGSSSTGVGQPAATSMTDMTDRILAIALSSFLTLAYPRDGGERWNLKSVMK